MTFSSSQASPSGTQFSDTRADELSILVDGYRWTGWQELEVVRAIDAAVGRFRVRISPTHGTTYPLRPGDEVEVALGEDDPLLTGTVDAVSAEFDKSGRQVTAEGRDRAAVLVDSTVELEAYEWRNQTLRQIVLDLIGPFGIEIGKNAGPAFERFDLFSCAATDKAWAVIERACRMKGLLAWSRSDGKLALARPGGATPEVDLIEGQNVIAGRLRWDYSGRFSRYRVEGQRGGSDEGWGDAIVSLAGEARDLEIPSFRPLTIRGEQGMTSEDCTRRAEWEATVRRARASAIEVTVSGWRQALDAENPYPPWEIDSTPYVELPSLGVQGNFLVSRVRYRRELKGGRTTQLELVPTDAFDPQPTVEPVEAFGGFLVSEGGSDDDF